MLLGYWLLGLLGCAILYSVFSLKIGIRGKYHVKKHQYRIQIPENLSNTSQNPININALPT